MQPARTTHRPGYPDDLAKVGCLVLPQLQLVKLGCETEETTPA